MRLSLKSWAIGSILPPIEKSLLWCLVVVEGDVSGGSSGWQYNISSSSNCHRHPLSIER